jgi:hypothetical protein
MVGSDGGQVTAGDSAAVQIPAGALTTTTAITVSPTSAAAPDATDEVGTPYLFGPEGTQFAVPVTITLAFNEGQLPSGDTTADIEIFTAPGGSTDYQALPTTLVDATHVSAATAHFSVYVAAAHKHFNDAGVVDAPATVHDAATVFMDAPGACTPVKAGTTGSCTFSATCNGHSYAIQCVQAQCTCSIDGGTGQNVFNVGTTCSGTDGQPGWAACGFPM